MTYVIVTGKNTVAGEPASTYEAAFIEATRRFGEDVARWLELNLRIEENR